jgi:hypothetical protein
MEYLRISYPLVFNSKRHGLNYLSLSFNDLIRNDKRFQDGENAGGTDVIEWAKTKDKSPLSLATRIHEARKHEAVR